MSITSLRNWSGVREIESGLSAILPVWFAVAALSFAHRPVFAQVLSITLNTNYWSMGTQYVGSVADTWYNAPGYFCVSNNGTLPARIFLGATNSTPSGWTLTNMAGANCFQFRYCLFFSQAPPIYLPLSLDEREIAHRLETNQAIRFDLEFRGPLATDNTNIEQTIDVSISAMEAE